jgi:hypothetical protein
MSAAKESVLNDGGEPAISTVLTGITPDKGEQYREWLAESPHQPGVCRQLRAFKAMVSGQLSLPKSWLLAKFLQRWILPAHEGIEQYAQKLAHRAVEDWKKDPHRTSNSKYCM